MGRFEDFGHDVGSLLRNMLLLIFPQKYYIDDRGILRPSHGPSTAAAKPVKGRHSQRISGSAFPLLVGCTFFVISAVFLASRSLQMCRQRKNHRRYDSVLERCSQAETPEQPTFFTRTDTDASCPMREKATDTDELATEVLTGDRTPGVRTLERTMV